ncbi:rod shape-determining protein RodA [Aerococcaceae bacterium zg-ZUI334]|uniref:FtsW/RodA/SpoVE family cell cycle protein n=1 Tax=Aerococcaceae TaxID=186827 RepID=UPI0013B88DAC|nr:MULTISPECIES: FtsW/RodA/SpoVE family cell cycle protein [unclassified Facklamia]MBR7928154.1 rod shape-determining protein RodA [Aerococcaceae bacterium zg-ZUI334]NEW65194.1 rod shape-determining protein RodA [Facklamia sp. 252]NEW68585.1 rod shape-determining protein RodA [Facklamia sp. 253]QQD65997.1 rod shape-determining protein RodA [Aerococcaceae bacterium zg-252]
MAKTRRLAAYNDNRIDYGIVLTIIILAIIGIGSVYATTVMIAGDNVRATLMHSLWYAIGAIVVIFVMQLDSEQYWKLSTYIYGFGLILLVLVLLFHDRATAAETGAKSWFRIGSFSFQPSEVFKPAYTVFLARVITEHNDKFTNRNLKSDWLLIGKVLLFAAPAIILIQLQNDLGTNLVIMSITAGMLLLSGISWRIILPAFLSVVIIGGGLIYLAMYQQDILLKVGFKPYQLQRIHAWLDPFGDTQGQAYQLSRSIIAIGSGGLAGKGFGVSEVLVPVRESDFIFTTIAENFGFLGSAFLLFIYFLLIYQMVQTCFETKNEFYTYIATGVISMILFHILENIGMSIGLLPITGVPLPFISQGGSALLSNLIGVGLVLSMRYHHRSYMFASDSQFEY